MSYFSIKKSVLFHYFGKIVYVKAPSIKALIIQFRENISELNHFTEKNGIYIDKIYLNNKLLERKIYYR